MGGASLLDPIIQSIESGDVELPPFSATAMAIRKELDKKEPSIKAIETQIIQDQALTSQILRVANSSYYRRLEEVGTVRGAILRLGANEVAKLVAVITQRAQYAAKDPFVRDVLNRLFMHSVVCAVGCSWAAQKASLGSVANEAFFSGLLHDVGKLFLFKVLEELKRTGKVEGIDSETTMDVVDGLHTSQGAMLLEQWNLPSTYGLVARDHHAEEYDMNNPLLVIVRLANRVCNKAGIGLRGSSDEDLSQSEEARCLGFDKNLLAEMELKLEDAMALIGVVDGE